MASLVRLHHGQMKGMLGALLFLGAFVAQQFAIDTTLTPIRPYMLGTVLVLFMTGIHLVDGGQISLRLVSLDHAVFLFYFLLLFTSLYATDAKLAIQMFLGVLMLLSSYVIIRCLLTNFDGDDFYRCFNLLATFYFVSSFLLYLIGLFSSFYLERPAVLLGESEAYALSWGVYFEAGVIPRLRGVTDSPNNFAMYGLILIPMWFFGGRRPGLFLMVLAVACVILTLSISAYVAIALMILAFSLWRIRLSSGRFGRNFMIAALTGAILVLLLVTVLAFFDEEYAQFINEVTSTRLEHAATGSGRFELWQYCFAIISDGPLWGFGLNQERILLAPFRNLQSVHNNVIGAYFAGGVVALFFYVVLLAQAALVFVSKAIPDRERVWLSLCWISMFVFSNVNETLFADSFFFSLAILSSAAHVFGRRQCEAYKRQEFSVS